MQIQNYSISFSPSISFESSFVSQSCVSEYFDRIVICLLRFLESIARCFDRGTSLLGGVTVEQRRAEQREDSNRAIWNYQMGAPINHARPPLSINLELVTSPYAQCSHHRNHPSLPKIENYELDLVVRVSPRHLVQFPSHISQMLSSIPTNNLNIYFLVYHADSPRGADSSRGDPDVDTVIDFHCALQNVRENSQVQVMLMSPDNLLAITENRPANQNNYALRRPSNTFFPSVEGFTAACKVDEATGAAFFIVMNHDHGNGDGALLNRSISQMRSIDTFKASLQSEGFERTNPELYRQLNNFLAFQPTQVPV